MFHDAVLCAVYKMWHSGSNTKYKQADDHLILGYIAFYRVHRAGGYRCAGAHGGSGLVDLGYSDI